ncbi:MAG TPA: glycosyltransferase [Gemmatimonadales bacterium]
MSRPDLVLVVPMYNEAARLRPAEFAACLAEQPRVRLLFVDDGSTDATAALVDAFVAGAPDRMTLLRLPRNAGKGEAVRAGMLAALRETPGALVGYWDADLATPLVVVPDFLGVLDRSAAVQAVIGARVQLLGRQIRRRAARHYLGRVFATAASLTLQAPVYDTQCGAKVFRPTPALAAALAQPWQSQWVFDVELLHRLIRWHGVPVDAIWEEPVSHWDDVAGSHVRLRDFCRAPLDLWRIRRQRPQR